MPAVNDNRPKPTPSGRGVLVQPPAADLPPAWDDMNAWERASFVLRWNLEQGYARRPRSSEEALGYVSTSVRVG